jgi:hypothetical protein
VTGRKDAETLAGLQLERLRRSGITIDRGGVFIHEGERVVHEGLRQALFRWLDRAPVPDGRYILRLDGQRFAYLEVVDTPIVARSARRDAEGVHLGLSDGTEELLDPATLTVDEAGILRCWVRGGVCEARLATSAAVVLADDLELFPAAASAPGSERLVLHAGRRDFPIRARPVPARG